MNNLKEVVRAKYIEYLKDNDLCPSEEAIDNYINLIHKNGIRCSECQHNIEASFTTEYFGIHTVRKVKDLHFKFSNYHTIICNRCMQNGDVGKKRRRLRIYGRKCDIHNVILTEKTKTCYVCKMVEMHGQVANSFARCCMGSYCTSPEDTPLLKVNHILVCNHDNCMKRANHLLANPLASTYICYHTFRKNIISLMSCMMFEPVFIVDRLILDQGGKCATCNEKKHYKKLLLFERQLHCKACIRKIKTISLEL